MNNSWPRREWEGDPTIGEGVTHAVRYAGNMNEELRTACGLYTDEQPFFYEVPARQTVTCLRCMTALLRA